nr:MAG TPA: HNH endonuclease, GmR87, NESG, Structural Genomics.6A [Caudoviricetes sp.]
MRHRTESLSIPPAVKQAVARRDSVDGHPCCILCGDPAPTDAPMAFSCAHYISRGQGGLGIEENILTLCPECHRLYDGEGRKVFRPILTRYLREHYTNWTEDDLYYKK